MCELCNHSGYVLMEYPAYGSDVVQVRERCACNPAPTDPEPPDWQDAPELWALNYPGIHYDATLPSGLLATQRLNDLQAVDPLA